ncbi:hypothetical protein CAEBREN_09694 [Caenorhabditis brenneri]|uniref:Protein kinase domain-containing protein n=1 Tax=Caenorhabditis brenneri TaxID=135651 RepID=G0PBJ3_CAEBE|nr:hypothetical protein CAEBREN_09694 [Caenorhabditis brenneri]
MSSSEENSEKIQYSLSPPSILVTSESSLRNYRKMDPIRLAPGLMVNKRYSILNCVGYGSFSTVYKAADTNKDNCEVILKLARTPVCDLKYEAEVDALKKCNGIPYFPTIFENFKLKTVTCIVESDAGESLDDVLSRSKKFSNENTLRVGYCLMKGLAHLHNCGVVHMDLNDGNVTLKRNGDGKISVFLIDLGNSSPSRPWKVVNLESRFTSLAVIQGKCYQEVDDLTSGTYLISIMSGMNALDPLNTQKGSRQGKTIFHSNPGKLFSSKMSWIPKIVEFCEKRDTDQLDMTPVWNIFETAVENVHPTSDITYSINENKVFID